MACESKIHTPHWKLITRTATVKLDALTKLELFSVLAKVGPIMRASITRIAVYLHPEDGNWQCPRTLQSYKELGAKLVELVCLETVQAELLKVDKQAEPDQSLLQAGQLAKYAISIRLLTRFSKWRNRKQEICVRATAETSALKPCGRKHGHVEELRSLALG